MKKEILALNYFNNEYNCAQSVLKVFEKEFNITEDIIKMGKGLGGGIGRSGLVCGALNAGCMIISKEFSNLEKIELNKKIFNFVKEFKKINGSENCGTLLGFDLWNDEEREQAKNSGKIENVCSVCIISTVKLLNKEFNLE